MSQEEAKAAGLKQCNKCQEMHDTQLRNAELEDNRPYKQWEFSTNEKPVDKSNSLMLRLWKEGSLDQRVS